MTDRAHRLFRLMRDEVDMVYLENGTSPHLDMTFFWITGLERGMFEGAVVLARPSGDVEVLTSALEEQTLRQYPDLGCVIVADKEEKKTVLAQRLGTCGKVGINPGEFTHAAYLRLRELLPDAELVDLTQPIKEARLIKDAAELDNLRRSCRIASDVAAELPGRLRPGMKENEVAAEIQYLALRAGAGGMAFETIVASGPYTAEPHYFGGERPLSAGEFLLADFGATYRRYCSDITRTWVLGEASEKQKAIHRAVAAMQEAALELIRPGTTARDVHLRVLEVLEQEGYQGRMPHSTGHSIGLATHDGGRLSDKDDLILREGMVFTVEPGVYLPGYGGVRIEDDVLVGAQGPELLTTAPRALTEVPF
jgi:Xaa-Pro dipeptidase